MHQTLVKKKKSTKSQPTSMLYVILKQNGMRKCNILAPRIGSYTVVFQKSCQLVWKHFSNLMGCPRENIRTQVICLFFFDCIIELCLSWLWRIILCALQNIQSTNWQTMRFKPPPPNSDIGWRVEFRPMEVRKASACTKTHFLLSGKVPGILPSGIKPSLLMLWFIPLSCQRRAKWTAVCNQTWTVGM